MFRYLPEQASTIAPKVDWLNNVITDLSVFFTVAIVGAMIFFAVKYRARKGVDHATPRIEGSHFLEAIWTIVPTVICIFVAAWGILIFQEMREVPSNALTVNVVGRQWKWDFQYENGKQTTTNFVVPVNTPVKLVLTARDVLHSFYIPFMRVKVDAIPGRYTYVAFTPVKTGDYDVFCTEYCGTEHSAMLAKLKVVSVDEFNKWVNDDSDKIHQLPPAEVGKAIFNEKGCASCHSLDGSRKVGPSFQKLFGKTEKFTDGSEAQVTEDYLSEAIKYPAKTIVAGYNNQMPAFDWLKPEEISALIAFIRSQDGSSVAEGSADGAPKFSFAKQSAAATPADRGKALYQSKACIGCHSLDGNKGVGPSFKGIYGQSQKLVDGSSANVDDAFLKESILQPNAKIVEGYSQGLMPAFEGQLTDAELADLIEFIKSVK